MKISTEIGSIAQLVGEKKAVELVADAGFDAFDFSMFCMCDYDWGKRIVRPTMHPLAGREYLKFVRELKHIATECGIQCNQSHAPFPTSCVEIRSYFKRAIECTAESGGNICVVHPDNNKTAEENAEMYFELLPFAKEHGVKIAAENMWNWDSSKGHCTFAACATPESFNAHLDAVGDEFLVACLDIGHAEMCGSGTTAVEMIGALGGRLAALHIHDNDKLHDSHQIPFSMHIDFTEIIEALRDNGYNGYFTLEADSYLNAYTKDNVVEGVRNLAKAANKLSEMFEDVMVS
ncbi:MAG: sugar phosphate isomerase/epimerase [Ruminococcaceae bacterium]|nr:sugar phosphate isomerase/epimerase [Oscillospiraceae bacterium]